MTLDRDPAKIRAWEQRSREHARDRAREQPRTGGLRARSPRKTARYAAIAEACRVALVRDGHRCQARRLVPEVTCWGPIDPQHVIPKGVDRTLAADPANIVALCRAHHDFVDVENDRMRALGFHGHYGDDLAELARRRTT